MQALDLLCSCVDHLRQFSSSSFAPELEVVSPTRKNRSYLTMEIVKDHAPNNSSMCLIQPHPYFESDFGSPSSHGFDEHHKRAFEEGRSSDKSTGVAKNAVMSSSSSLSSPRSTNSDGLGYPAVKYGPEEGHSVISFKAGYGNFAESGGSLLSFDQNERFSQNSFTRMINNQDDHSIWENNLHYNYQNQLNSRCNATNPQLVENSNNIKTANSYASTSSEVSLGWLSSEPNANSTMNCVHVLGRPEACSIKRPYEGESTHAIKKQCTAVTKMPKSKSKDPQSIAAKNRRERISERLKILQDLVPNGSKVDLVTMLEKAISYVKFLQLQVKVLAADEFWPSQGGKAPDLSQVREAIDSILASQRDRNSSSK